jgi:hypothetical protein
MNKQLLPLTRLILVVSAAVQLIFAAVDLFLPDLANTLLWSPPLQPWTLLSLRFNGAIYLACALGAILAFSQNTWEGARVYLAIGGSYVALSLIITLMAAFTPPGIPFIVWVYVVLAILYLPLLASAWMQESRQAAM